MQRIMWDNIHRNKNISSEYTMLCFRRVIRWCSQERNHPVQVDEPPSTRYHHQGQRFRGWLQDDGQPQSVSDIRVVRLLHQGNTQTHVMLQMNSCIMFHVVTIVSDPSGETLVTHFLHLKLVTRNLYSIKGKK